MSIAPVMLDLEGLELSNEETEILGHPLTGGVIFFSRNYESVKQLSSLIQSVRKVTNSYEKDLLIAVDHEGGRVQRFRSEFTELPAIATLADSQDPSQKAFSHGWLMASEVRAMDIDFSFAPVLDINYGVSGVIGDRSFNRDPEVISKLASEYIKGMREAGMASTGKHFPGHGAVVEDSHLEIPIDRRTKEQIWKEDIIPFTELIKQGLDAIMPAHVIYEALDNKPAGFSSYWLQQVLRNELKFDGVIFSDDLSMEGASVAGGFANRAEAAMTAGCDMILVCNNRQGAIEVLDNATIKQTAKSAQRLLRMKGASFMNRSSLLDSKRWAESVKEMTYLA
ncbi:MAG: beta-N-acetylhexosaminidase [Cocleimonas sp.]|jgi:beta-N-acetylhexosaminidase